MPALFLFIPLAGVFIMNLPSRKTGLKIGVWVAGIVCVLQMGIAATFGWSAWQGVAGVLALPFGASLQVDFLSAAVLFTIGLVALMSLIVGGRRAGLNFMNLVLVSMMGMSGIAMVRDLFSLYIFLEITGVSSYVMIAMRKDSNGLEGAFKYLLMSAVATLMMLTALSLVFMTVQKVDFASVSHYLTSTQGSWPVAMKAALILLVAGFSIKAGLVPFHGWVPGAYSAAPNEVSVLLAGIITKAGGVYVILRMMNDVFKGANLGLPFMVLGAVSIVVGALAAIGQKDMKKMLAWSSISQVGYIILGAGLGTPLAIAGALLHFFNHATFKSLLFVNAAAVEEQTGTRDMEQLGGLASKMKITGGTSVVGFLSTAGVPPLSGFWSKLLIIVALWGAGQYFYATVALGASILTLAYFLIMQRKVFFGKLREGLEGIRESGARHTVPALILAGVTVFVGVLFPFVLRFMDAQGLFK
jgi:proton-translocating NADH-quinone oxidoreductase chain N